MKMNRVVGPLVVILMIALAVGCGGSTTAPTPTAPTANVAGTWIGTIKSNAPTSPDSGKFSVNITQSGDTILGSGVVSNTCFATFQLQGTVTGNLVAATLQTNDGGVTNWQLTALLKGTSTVQEIRGPYATPSGSCAGDTGTIDLVPGPVAIPDGVGVIPSSTDL